MAGENTIKLSILIPTVPRRKAHLERLLATLEPQLTDEVELLVLMDNKKSLIGSKRQKMIDISQGEYIVFIDDDDEIIWDYVSYLLNACEWGFDVICFDCEVSIDGKDKEICKFSTQYKDSFVGWIHYRTPNHLMCFRRDVAIKERYGNIRHGEDFEWSNRILKHIESETNIDEVLYHYKSIPSNSECY